MNIDWQAVLMCFVSSLVGILVGFPSAWFALKGQVKSIEDTVSNLAKIVDQIEKEQGVHDRRITSTEATLQSATQQLGRLEGAISSLQQNINGQFLSLYQMLLKQEGS